MFLNEKVALRKIIFGKNSLSLYQYNRRKQTIHATSCFSEMFSEYVFKEGATHGKDEVFVSLGYGKQHSTKLAFLYQEQGLEKFKNGDFTYGKKDHYGQRINIEIELPAISGFEKKTSYLKSGWMILEDGNIKLNTPFTGFTR